MIEKENIKIMKVYARNRKASYEYEIIEKYDAGISLRGTEVKSIRAGRVNLTEGYIVVRNAELFLINVHISEYKQGNIFNHPPRRSRKLLLRKREINRIIGTVQQKGLTMVPLLMYDNGGWIKLELAVVRGKKKYDKRESIRKREADREIERAMKWRKKGY